ncbi:MAG: proline/glycine betaine ABC transporter permease [Rhodospirillaceae bacterium]|nr:proline/glycine betaine ABC transporter permease [Rhodospirillaceae bacterium]
MFPDSLTITIAPAINRAVDALIADNAGGFRLFADAVLAVIVFVEQALRAAPWWLVILLAGVAAFAASRRIGFGVGTALALLLVGVFGLWDPAMQTLALMLVATTLSAIIGVPLGVALTRSTRASTILRPVLDAMQTLPSFVYLVPAMMVFGLGKVPALLATVIYATPPIVRLTELGIRNVSAEAVEAAIAFGATARQKFWHVEFPLALPSIMAGINQATMLALSMVVVASMIGARGLGEEVLVGIQRLDVGRGLVAGIVIVLLAIVLDRITQAFGAPHTKPTP